MALRLDRNLRLLMLALALTCALGWLFKGHCAPGGWTHSEQYTTGCYSDAVPFWDGRGVAAGELPYLQARMEYPVLTGGLIWVEGRIAHAVGGKNANATHFLAIVTLGNALLATLVLWMFWRAGMDAARLWAWALAPPLILYVGHNWDMLAVALAVGAVLLARRNRLVAAAAAAGLGVAAKLFPILLLPLVGLEALFARDRSWLQRLVRAALVTAAAVGVWALVNLPVALLAPTNWAEFYTFSSARSGTAAAIWDILDALGVLRTSIPTRNLVSGLLFVAGAGVIVAAGWQAHRDRLWILFAPLLAWFLLTNKVYSPQFDLWLYPMLLVAAPRLKPVAVFVAAGIAAYFAEFWFFAGIEGAWPSAQHGHVAIAALIRGAAMLTIIVDVLQRPPPEWVMAPRGQAGAA